MILRGYSIIHTYGGDGTHLRGRHGIGLPLVPAPGVAGAGLGTK